MKHFKWILIAAIAFLICCTNNNQSLSSGSEYGIGNARLGMSFNEFLKNIDHDTIKKYNDGQARWEIFKSGKRILVLYDKNDLKDLVVRLIDIYSPELITTDGVHVGMTVDDLLKKYPDTKLDSDLELRAEFFAPQQIQVRTNTGETVIGVYLFVTGKDKKPLGIDNNYPADKFSREGTISMINIIKESL